MLPVMIVDDEPLAADRLVRLCAQIDGIEIVAAESDGQAALASIERLHPRLLLLDISMPGLDGLALAGCLARRETRPAVIFVTAHDEFAVAAFELAATDYVLKPVSLARLALAISRVGAGAGAGEPPQDRHLDTLWVPRGREMVRIGVASLELLEAERDYVRLHARGRTHLLRATLNDLERRLDPARFVRIHRSAIVPVDRVRALRSEGGGAWTVHLLDGRVVGVGRSFRPRARALLAGRS